MSRKTVKKKIERIKYNDYQKVAEDFFNGASVVAEFQYWNTAGVLAVHSAIAYADAVCIKFAGVKCQGDDHNQIVTLLKEILPISEDNRKAFLQIEKIISHKTAVSYSGDIYDKHDTDNLLKYLERFRKWAESTLKE